MDPCISVLIPVYGVEKYIEKCLRSLFENTIADKCEFIIVNDCTKDKSITIAQEIKNQYQNLDIKIIEHEKNLGLAGARNTGLQNAQGKYIICCDSDDWVEKNYLEELYNEAEKENADITTCGYIIENENEKVYEMQQLDIHIEKLYKDFLLNKVKGFLWCKLFKKTLFTNNNISWDSNINMWEDVNIVSKILLCANTFSSVDKYLYHYRHTDSKSMVHSKELKKFSEIFLVLKNIKKNLTIHNLYETYKNEFLWRVLFEKKEFTMSFNSSKNFLKNLYTRDEILVYHNHKNMFTKGSQIYFALVERKLYNILKLFTYINGKKGHYYMGQNKFKDSELDFLKI